MPLYVGLITLTDQGNSEIFATVDRAKTFWRRIDDLGGKVLQHLWLMGSNIDAFIVFEMSDNAKAQRLKLEATNLGNVRFEVTGAFDAAQMAEVISADSLSAFAQAQET